MHEHYKPNSSALSSANHTDGYGRGAQATLDTADVQYDVRCRPLIYCAGYYGQNPWAFVHWLNRTPTIAVVDIRQCPNSRWSGWGAGNLLQRIHEGGYFHLPQWGNANYNTGGPIEIADFDDGLDRFERMQWPEEVLLLCACRDADRCHRSVVAGLLRQYGYSVEEFDWQRVQREAQR